MTFTAYVEKQKSRIRERNYTVWHEREMRSADFYLRERSRILSELDSFQGLKKKAELIKR